MRPALGFLEVELLKLGEVLNEGQAATHLGFVEAEVLKLGEVLKEGQAAIHLGFAEPMAKPRELDEKCS